MDAPARIVSTPKLKEGVLLNNRRVKLELVRDAAGKPPAIVTTRLYVDHRPEQDITYFNIKPPEGLEPLIVPFIEDYKPGNLIGLHRVVAAAAGKAIKKGWTVHHLDHNHLDNRAKNLKPLPRDEHEAYHLQYNRLREGEQMRLFPRTFEGLFLRITLKSPADPHAPLGYVAEDEGGGADLPPSPDGPYNVHQTDVRGTLSIENVFELSSVADGLVLSYAPTLGLRQLKALGLKGKRGQRAAEVLEFIARQEGLTKFRALQARFCPKRCTRSTLQETLRELVSRGILIHLGHRYGLHRSAVKGDGQL